MGHGCGGRQELVGSAGSRELLMLPVPPRKAPVAASTKSIAGTVGEFACSKHEKTLQDVLCAILVGVPTVKWLCTLLPVVCGHEIETARDYEEMCGECECARSRSGAPERIMLLAPSVRQRAGYVKRCRHYDVLSPAESELLFTA